MKQKIITSRKKDRQYNHDVTTSTCDKCGEEVIVSLSTLENIQSKSGSQEIPEIECDVCSLKGKTPEEKMKLMMDGLKTLSPKQIMELINEIK